MLCSSILCADWTTDDGADLRRRYFWCWDETFKLELFDGWLADDFDADKGRRVRWCLVSSIESFSLVIAILVDNFLWIMLRLFSFCFIIDLNLIIILSLYTPFLAKK